MLLHVQLPDKQLPARRNRAYFDCIPSAVEAVSILSHALVDCQSRGFFLHSDPFIICHGLNNGLLVLARSCRLRRTLVLLHAPLGHKTFVSWIRGKYQRSGQ